MNTLKKLFLLACLIIPITIYSGINETPNFPEDEQIIENTRKSMLDILTYVKANPEIFPPQKQKEKRLTNREQRKVIWQTWQAFLDRILVLDDIGQRYDMLYRELDEKEEKQQAFRIGYAAFLIQYRYAIEFITMMENDPSMHTMLNESVPELGLNTGTYKDLKFRFLNVLRGAEFARLETLYKLYGDDENLSLTQGIDKDRKALWKQGGGNGTKQTVKNAVKIIKDTGFTAWFPVQKEVSEWMGDFKVHRLKSSLINEDQIAEIQELLQPGDIILERREWYLSNIGLPGYWPHSALYIGTPEEREMFFADENLNGSFDEDDLNLYLEKRYPEAYKLSLIEQEHHHVPRVIEAISEGVSFTTLEHSLSADSIAILRPRLSKLDKAIAISRAFHFSGRPYDFNFDFVTDSELVCSELIYKAYESNSDYIGLTFPLQEVLGRKVTTANDMAQMFDEEYNKADQQLEFIAFYDGHERQRKAISSDVNIFRKSWKRSKWFIWIQDTPLARH